jgi:hypothetical protein
LRRSELALAFFKFGQLAAPGFVEPTAPDEFDDTPQLVAIKPRTVLLAHIDYHIRVMGEIDSIHKLSADRTGKILDLILNKAAGSNRQVGYA